VEVSEKTVEAIVAEARRLSKTVEEVAAILLDEFARSREPGEPLGWIGSFRSGDSHLSERSEDIAPKRFRP
ncbi:MAG TPA: hypothetical protein VMD59_07070, partial [Acidimicrobiales bacterium]|nr:hypothetical protein [Acidimicrobiales bacterium]